MPRNSYKISQKDKERLREKYNRGEDFVHFVKLCAKTELRVLRDEDAPANGGKRYQKFDDKRDYLIECLECNPLLTLRQLNAKLQNHFPAKPQISDKTLSNKIDGLAYTLKLSRDVSSGRREYAEWYLSPQTVQEDNTSMNLGSIFTSNDHSLGLSEAKERTVLEK